MVSKGAGVMVVIIAILMLQVMGMTAVCLMKDEPSGITDYMGRACFVLNSIGICALLFRAIP